MSKQIKIFFTFCKSKKIEYLFKSQNNVLWLFLAKDYTLLKKLEGSFSDKFSRFDISKLQNDVADDIRCSYVQWVDSLNEINGRELEWWFTTISSRNVSETDLFQFACYLELLKRIHNECGILPDLIIVESLGLAWAIKRWAIGAGAEVEIVGQLSSWCMRLRGLFYFILRWSKWVSVVISRIIAARATQVLYKNSEDESENSVIINTYVHYGDILNDGRFNDRYFPFLHEFLAENGFSVRIYPILHGFHFNFFPIFRAMRMGNSSFLIAEDYLHFSDYLSALKLQFKFSLQKIKTVSFNDFEMKDIIREEQVAKFTRSMVEAVLVYRLFIRIGEKGLRPKRVILWYENQVIHKAVIAGARAAFPDAKIVGAQLFIHRPNLLSLFPSISEFKKSLTPHILLSTSSHQCAVATTFAKSLTCRPAAALRYAHLFNGDSFSKDTSDNEEKILLILLPFDIVEAAELLQYVKEALHGICKDVRILVKGHQDYTIKKLKKVLGKNQWLDRFEIYEGSLSDILNKTMVVVASNSGAIIEAAVMGIPVIVMGRQTVLNQDNVSDLDAEIVTQCFSSAEMAEAINRYIRVYPQQEIVYKKIGARLRERFFTPVDKNTLAPFVEA